jgi:hypothetical protein
MMSSPIENYIIELNTQTVGAYSSEAKSLLSSFPRRRESSGFNPNDPLDSEPTVGASLLAKNFASKLAPTIGKASNGQSGFKQKAFLNGWIPACAGMTADLMERHLS